MRYYIVPEISGLRPDPATVCRLIGALRSAGFLCDPESAGFAASAHGVISLASGPDEEGFWWQTHASAKKHGGSLDTLEDTLSDLKEMDVLITWPNSDLHLSGLKYPLSMIPGPSGVYYNIEFHLAAETVYHVSEIVDAFDKICCPCGASIKPFNALGRELFYDQRLPNHCPACQSVLNYATLPATVRNPWNGAKSSVLGGLSYRFAVMVDCGSYYPGLDAVVTPAFLSVLEDILGLKTRVIQDGI
jgi:hypothetical protein